MSCPKKKKKRSDTLLSMINPGSLIGQGSLFHGLFIKSSP